ncbi:MAG: PIG-L family deacetylase [Propionicimonas sp.]|nr:PIG-L family deacetylase [Propionicimonas sp.]
MGLIAAPRALAADAGDCSGGAIQIIAHEDDDLLFQSPDLLRDVDAKRCVRSVYVTAGDSGYEDDYWQSREKGSEAAWADMADVSNSWTTSTISLAGKSVRLRTLRDAPNISIIFMRLPDGFPLGTGSPAQGNQSLYRLLTGAISSMSAVDGSASYTASTLRNALLDAVRDKDSTWIRTQDFLSFYGADQDHYDHHAVSFLARDAAGAYENDAILSSYLGYGDFVNNGMWP